MDDTKKHLTIKSKNVKIAIIGFTLLFLVGTLGYLTYTYNVVKNWENKIYPGVKIEGIDISGKSKDEAKAIIKQKHGDVISKRKINVIAENKNFYLEFSKLNYKYNTEDTINSAFKFGKDKNLVGKYSIISKAASNDFKLKVEYDAKKLKEFIGVVESSVNKNPVDATIQISGNQFNIMQDSKGTKLHSEKLQKEIVSKINEAGSSDIFVKGVMETANARITADNLKPINKKIASYSTEFANISSPPRANNIIIATRYINGKTLLPGDTFSFNDVVGERTADKGYEAAQVIVGNLVESGLGGGICQVSTTLYNAILRSNIKSTERSHHTLPSHYVPLGMDATVDYDNLDYKFTNTFPYAVYIEGSTAGGNVVFNIYSNSELADTYTEVYSEVYGTYQPTIKYVDDPTMPEGKTEQVQPPSTGYKVKVTKKTFKNGAVISEDLVSDDYYKPVDTIIKKGTKKVKP